MAPEARAAAVPIIIVCTASALSGITHLALARYPSTVPASVFVVIGLLFLVMAAAGLVTLWLMRRW